MESHTEVDHLYRYISRRRRRKKKRSNKHKARPSTDQISLMQTQFTWRNKLTSANIWYSNIKFNSIISMKVFIQHSPPTASKKKKIHTKSWTYTQNTKMICDIVLSLWWNGLSETCREISWHIWYIEIVVSMKIPTSKRWYKTAHQERKSSLI